MNAILSRENPDIKAAAHKFKEDTFYSALHLADSLVFDDIFEVLDALNKKINSDPESIDGKYLMDTLGPFQSYLTNPKNTERVRGLPKGIELKSIHAYDKEVFEWKPHFTRSGEHFISLIDPLSRHESNYAFNRTFMEDTAREENNWRRERGFDYGTPIGIDDNENPVEENRAIKKDVRRRDVPILYDIVDISSNKFRLNEIDDPQNEC